MRIAIASRGLEVSPRYDLAEDLTCYNVERGIIVGCQNMPFPKMAISKLIETFSSLGIDTFIAGAISYDAAKKLCDSGIEVIAGVSGPSKDAAKAYLSETLSGVDELCGGEEPCSL